MAWKPLRFVRDQSLGLLRGRKDTKERGRDTKSGIPERHAAQPDAGGGEHGIGDRRADDTHTGFARVRIAIMAAQRVAVDAELRARAGGVALARGYVPEVAFDAARWQAARVIGRVIFVSMLALGCDAPLVVNCDTGRFVEAGDDHWCLFGSSDRLACPMLLPVEHDLPWGGRGCAAREHDPLPPELCVAAGACDADGGAP